MTVVEDFAADYFVRERLSEGRRRFVLYALARFETFAGAPAEQLTHRELDRFLTHLVGEGAHVNTVRKYNHAIKPFYKWAWRTGVLDADTWLRVQDVKNPRGATGQGKPRPYKRTEIARFWAELEAKYPLAEPRFIARWQRGTSRYNRVWTHAVRLELEAAAGLALFGGLRISEIAGADLADLHPDNDFIVVRGKTEVWEEPKIREVPYTEHGRELMGAWLDFRDLMGPEHDRPWLVCDPRGGVTTSLVTDPASFRTIAQWLGKIGPAWDWHRFRHTAATEWLRSGMKLEKVSKLLGHANLQQTLVYAQLLNDDVASDMRRNEELFIGNLRRRPAAQGTLV